VERSYSSQGVRGLGGHFCKAFLKEGAKVVVTDITEKMVSAGLVELTLDSTLEAVVNLPTISIGGRGTNRETPRPAGHPCKRCRGPCTPHLKTSDASWDKVVDVNLKGTFLCCQVAVEQFRKQGSGGKIVNVSALAGRWLGSLAGCHYTAAKAGVIGLTRHLAHELGPEGIYVNAIAPTITLASQRTEDLWAARSDEYKAKVLSEIPLRRLSTPEEVAAGVIFLCSDEASYLTGVTLDINGGRFFS
jgi:NAD(P)-dependent dehydrogenase (short-subunit alcohol dehydrogenase family)